VQPGLYALLNQCPLKLGHSADDLKHQSAGWCGQVQVIPKTDERDAQSFEFRHGIYEMAQRTAEAIQLPRKLVITPVCRNFFDVRDCSSGGRRKATASLEGRGPLPNLASPARSNSLKMSGFISSSLRISNLPPQLIIPRRWSWRDQVEY
jgi:hypothetical protein